MSTTYATRDSEPVADREAEQGRADRQTLATTDPNASSRITIAASRPSASPTPAGGCSNAKYRSPPASICSDDARARSSRRVLSFARSSGSEVLALGVLDPDQRDLAVGRDDPDSTAACRPARRAAAGSVVARTVGSAAMASWIRVTSACAAGESRKVAPAVLGGEDDVRAESRLGRSPPARAARWRGASPARVPRTGPRGRVRTRRRR